MPFSPSQQPAAVPFVPHLRRAALLIPLSLIVLLAAALAYVLLTAPKAEPAPLGASVQVPGGVARVSGVLPLEADGWLPTPSVEQLSTPPADGAHRVRVLLQVTATDAGGVPFRAADYRIGGFGAVQQEAVWSSPVTRRTVRGETVQATLVYEVPDEGISLTLRGPADSVLALGPGHHRGN